MIALPFVVFFSWFVFNYRKNGLDVGTYILLLYVVTSFFAILIDCNNYYYELVPHRDLGIIAPLLYCGLLSLCIYPFTLLKTNRIRNFNFNISEKKLSFVVYVYFFMFLFILITTFSRLNEILFESTLADVRYATYMNESEPFYYRFSGITRNTCALIQLLSGTGLILVPLFFYSIAFLKKPFWFNMMLLLGSMTRLLLSVMTADRSQIFYWLILMGLSYVFFRKHIGKKSKKTMYVIMLIMAGIVIAYFTAVTVSRWGERDGGAFQGMIIYAGQPYINFCNFFNNLKFDTTSLSIIFPFTSTFILGVPGYFAMAEKIYAESHIHIEVFSSFLGFIMSVSGIGVMIIYSLLYWGALRIYIINKNNRVLTLKKFVILWIFLMVPVLGFFTFFYAFSDTTIPLVVWPLMSYFLANKKSRKKTSAASCSN